MRVIAYGHHNVLAAHPTTLEFTTEDFLTLRGDCILGINAVFQKPEWTTPQKIKITITVDEITDELEAVYNPHFSSTTAMVIRKSSYVDARTFAIHATKAAKDIKREIVKKLKDPMKRVEMIITICKKSPSDT